MNVRDIVVPLLISLVLALAGIAGSRLGARQQEGEWRLQPTWFAHIFLVILLSVLVLLLWWSTHETRPDQLAWTFVLAASDSIFIAFWLWLFYLRTIYWNENEVGTRSRFLKKKFVRWQDAIWAGRGWSGSFKVKSKTDTITYIEFMGGSSTLIEFTKKKLPQFEKNFF